MDILYASDLQRDYRIPESTWRYWHQTGRLSAAKVGRRLVWKRDAVVKFLADQGLDVAV